MALHHLSADNQSQPDLLDHGWRRDPNAVPLAERMRPTTIEAFAGQGHIVGEGRVLRRILERAGRRVPSLILWGPPGVGKTTLAGILAGASNMQFVVLSATQSGVAQLRAVIGEARTRRRTGRGTLLFIDEIHRFNKAQQDALLPHVEAGVCSLIGATTENPSFEVNAALLSRTRVLQLRPIEIPALAGVLRRALEDEDRGLGGRGLTAPDGLLAALAHAARGDARRALNTLELAADLLPEGQTELTREIVSQALGGASLRYDKDGEEHYNVVSALIKSMRASDPDGAVYWLARMLEAGEDVNFVSRRLLIFASEDIGNADPQALTVASAAAQAAHQVGLPEAVLPLTQACLYLALARKSNAVLTAYANARKAVHRFGALDVPLAVRNAVTPLMKASQYGVGYKYPHDFEGNVVPGGVSYLPDRLQGTRLVEPSAHGWEAQARARLDRLTRGEAADAGTEGAPE